MVAMIMELKVIRNAVKGLAQKVKKALPEILVALMAMAQELMAIMVKEQKVMVTIQMVTIQMAPL